MVVLNCVCFLNVAFYQGAHPQEGESLFFCGPLRDCCHLSYPHWGRWSLWCKESRCLSQSCINTPKAGKSVFKIRPGTKGNLRSKDFHLASMFSVQHWVLPCREQHASCILVLLQGDSFLEGLQAWPTPSCILPNMTSSHFRNPECKESISIKLEFNIVNCPVLLLPVACISNWAVSQVLNPCPTIYCSVYSSVKWGL